MGSSEPRDALMASTSVLPIDMPMALIPWPNMMAPKPQAKPAMHATTIECAGLIARTFPRLGTVMRAMTAGIAIQDTSIKIAQTFSQDQRPRYFIGRVNNPFMIPATMASRIPVIKVEWVKITDSFPNRTNGCQPVHARSHESNLSDLAHRGRRLNFVQPLEAACLLTSSQVLFAGKSRREKKPLRAVRSPRQAGLQFKITACRIRLQFVEPPRRLIVDGR